MDYATGVEHAAKRAACLTRQEYEAERLHETLLCYDIARQSALDRGYTLCQNVDVITAPSNVAAAFLKMYDDERALQGLPRKWQYAYRPRVIYN